MQQPKPSATHLASLTRSALLLACITTWLCTPANASTAAPLTTTIRTTDITIKIQAGIHSPSLIQLSGTPQNIWLNTTAETLPQQIYRDNLSITLTWTFNKSLSSTNPHHILLVYDSSQPHLRLTSEWTARSTTGPIEHQIHIANLSDTEIWLPLIDSLRLDVQIRPNAPIQNFYVEKGADTPSAQGTHLDPVPTGYNWLGRSSTYAHPVANEQREIIPAEIISSSNHGFYAGIEFSGRTRITLARNNTTLTTVLGLNPELGPFRTRLQPNETFDTPTIFLGAFSGTLDDAGNQLRAWIRSTLTNPKTWQDPQYPLMNNDSWGSGMQVDEPLALKMIANSKALGLEMFQLDAGWFRGIGDWYPDTKKFPHGLAFIADQAHQSGLRFGLWVDWTQAGTDTSPQALNIHTPQIHDWLVNDLPPNWKPEEFKGQTIDLGVPAAQQYASKEVKRIVDDYHLDMLEHDGYLVAQACTRTDHPHAPPTQPVTITHDAGFDFALNSNSTDVSYHSVRSYYSIYEKLRRDHPGLLFEICNDGGRMVDFGSAAHGDYFSITDTYDPLSNRRAFFDASYLLPPAMLESYIAQIPTPTNQNFLYMLRSGMMGWMSIMLDTTVWSPQQQDLARHAFATYKNKLRPLIRDARLYHVSARPDGIHWDAIEFWNPQQGRGVLFVFRGTVPDQPLQIFHLAGLDPSAHYALHFEDKTSPDQIIPGQQLQSSGITVHLTDPQSSELVFLEKTN